MTTETTATDLTILTAAVEEAADDWTGIDWAGGISDVDVDDLDLERLADALEEVSYYGSDPEGSLRLRQLPERIRSGEESVSELRELARDLQRQEREDVEQAARSAADLAADALALAAAGEWAEAIDRAERAAEHEREYGDAPVWGPVAELFAAALAAHE